MLHQRTERSGASSTPCPGSEAGPGLWGTRRQRAFWETACCSTARSSEPPLNSVISSRILVLSVTIRRFCWFVVLILSPVSRWRSFRCGWSFAPGRSGQRCSGCEGERRLHQPPPGPPGLGAEGNQGEERSPASALAPPSPHLLLGGSVWFCSTSWRRWTVSGWTLTIRGDGAGKSLRERSSKPGGSLWHPKSWQRGACWCCCRRTSVSGSSGSSQLSKQIQLRFQLNQLSELFCFFFGFLSRWTSSGFWPLWWPRCSTSIATPTASCLVSMATCRRGKSTFSARPVLAEGRAQLFLT